MTAPPPAPTAVAPPLAAHERSHLVAAALHARRVHPGPLGELAARELIAFAQFGYRFGRDDLVAQLARELLAARAPEPSP